MSKSSHPTQLGPRRIWSDPLFYVILGVISATYILLIVAMLLADAAYIFTSDMRRDARVDFETYESNGGDELFADGEAIDEQFRSYGLTVTARDGDGSLWPMIVNSTNPPGSLEHIGSPHQDFGGIGTGDGGGASAPPEHRNNVKLRNVLTISHDENELRPAEDGGTLVFEWSDPVRVDEVRLLDIHKRGGSIVTFDSDNKVLAEKPLRITGANSVQSIEFLKADAQPADYQSRVVRMEIHLPNSGAVSEIRFKWHGHVREEWEKEYPALSRLTDNPITRALAKPEIQYSITLSLVSCTITAILSVWVAVPVGYLLSRHRFFGRNLIDATLDIPIVLPPLVVGLSLLILFKFAPQPIQEAVVFQKPAVILAQFAVACAFAVRTMRATFDQIDARREQVALTLGCSRAQAFGTIVLPEAWRGILTAGTLAWARALGEFGPLLIFAGATRNKTEVLSTTVFLELSVGDLGAAVAVSLIMVVGAVIVLIVARLWGTRSLTL